MLESLIGYCNPSADTYAKRMLAAATATDLPANVPLLFGQSGNLIEPEAAFTQAAAVAAWIKAADDLVSKAAARGTGAAQ